MQLISKKSTFLTRSILLCLMVSPASAENLLQVYQHAKLNDAQLMVSENGYLASLEAKPQVLSGLKPRVDLSVDSRYNLQNTRRAIQGNGNADFANLGYQLTLSKPVFDKKLDAQIEQVDESLLQAKANLEEDRQDLIVRVAEAYFQFLDDAETLAFRKAEKTAIGSQLKQAKAFFEAGRSPLTDVKEAQAQYDLANAQVAVANQQIDISRETLKAITTRYYKSLNGAADNIPLLTPKPHNIEAWAKSAINNSKQIAAAQYAVNIAQKTVDIERAVKTPTVDLVAKHSGGSTFGETAFEQDKFDTSVGLQLNVPLYQGGNISSRIRQARHQLRQARQQLELQKRLATQQTRSAYLSIISGLAQVKALKQALSSTQIAAKATQAGFEAGTRTALDVLLSLRETFSAKRDYSTARYAFLLNTLRLKQATGTLSEADLAAISKLLNKRSKS